jgi:glycosyltransferase involved in cell wall biosynthesis
MKKKQSHTKSKLQICFLAFDSQSRSIGGLNEDEFQKRISEISENQIECTFVLTGCGVGKSTNVKIIRLKRIKWLPVSLSYLLSVIKNLYILIKQDVYIAHSPELDGFFVCLICKLFRKKSLITIHGHYEEEWEIKNYHILGMIFRKIYERFSLKYANLITVNDIQIKDKIISKDVNPSCLSIRYVFVDTIKFNRKSIDQQKLKQIKSFYKLPEKYILYIGRLDEWDGVDDFLKIFKKTHNEISSVKGVIIGKGPLKSEVKSFIEKNDFENIILQIDEVDHEMMPYFYYGAEIVLLPMHPPQAGVGRIMLEALSMEIPLITTDIGVFYEVVINGETGYRISEGDIDLMASMAVSLLKNPELIKKLGKNGRKLVESKYSVEQYIENWVKSLKYVTLLNPP